jgi:hypothetical protein
MKCFVHQSVDAVGLCRNCSRGVCAECAADRESGIACKGRCESEVDAMHALVRRNVVAAGKPGVLHWAQVVIYLGIAAFAGVVAFNAEDTGTIVLMAMLGLLMGICGLMVLRWALINVRPKARTAV